MRVWNIEKPTIMSFNGSSLDFKKRIVSKLHLASCKCEFFIINDQLFILRELFFEE
jgi:hypothetical protein